MKTCMTLCTLILSVAMCSETQANGCFLGRLMNRGGCGCPTSCCDAPTSCGRGFQIHLGVHVQMPRLRGNCCAPAPSCGCDQPAAAPCCDANPCCDNGCGGGLLSGFGGFGFGRRGGCCQPANDCNPCDRVSIFDNFRGRLSCRQPSCCEPAPADCCAPRCRERRQVCFSVPNFGLIDRFRSSGCGCDSGCDTGCDSGCGRVRCRPVRTRMSDCGCGCDPCATGAAPAGEQIQEGTEGGSEGGVEPTPGNGAHINNIGDTINTNSYIIRGARFAK